MLNDQLHSTGKFYEPPQQLQSRRYQKHAPSKPLVADASIDSNPLRSSEVKNVHLKHSQWQRENSKQDATLSLPQQRDNSTSFGALGMSYDSENLPL